VAHFVPLCKYSLFSKTKELKELNKTLEHRVTEEIKKNEEKQKLLFLQSRMASLGQMLGNIAHQWRQPLTELNLTLFNMKKFFNTNEKEKLDELYIESKNLISSMSSTIDDFSNFFNPQKDKKSFEIKKAVDEAVLILKKAIEDITLNIDVPLNYQVVGILNELTQVIINLIQNSKDAFILNNIKNKIIEISLSEEKILDKKYAKLEIKDNAGGISKDNLDKIFDPYFTTKHKSQGTGLGLFMSKMIIEKSLEGELIHSNCKNGSTFTIIIPLNN
jgi:C4-dicarboxylate-specific signal transduction histidine kinase